MWVIRSETHNILVRIANREDPDRTASEDSLKSDLGLHCLSRSFWQATSVQNFRIFKHIVNFMISHIKIKFVTLTS